MGAMTKTRVPAIAGWFTVDDEPALLGARGTVTGSYFWPTTIATSANPNAPGEPREAVLLSRRGSLWSWSTHHYPGPEPYVSPDPFVPYTVCAVELARESMVVLGLLADGVEPSRLAVGMGMELTIGPLYEDDDHKYVVWKWCPSEEVP